MATHHELTAQAEPVAHEDVFHGRFVAKALEFLER
jgi:hypothetical protein